MGLFGIYFYFVFSNHNFFQLFKLRSEICLNLVFLKKFSGTLFSSHILKLNLNKFFCLVVCFQFKFWVAFTYIVEDYLLPQFFFSVFWSPFFPTTHVAHYPFPHHTPTPFFSPHLFRPYPFHFYFFSFPPQSPIFSSSSEDSCMY